MTKNKKKPIVFKSCQGMFCQILLEADNTTKKFRSSNLDWALHKGIEDGWLFIMPKGFKFAYSRGTGPVSLNKVRLGRHEKTIGNTPDWNSPRMITATYQITLFDDENGEEDKQVMVDISIPSRFTDFYVERSEGIAHNPSLKKLEFVYKVNEFRVWMREFQMEIYGEEESECNEEIRNLKQRIVQIRGMRTGQVAIPHQSAFD